MTTTTKTKTPEWKWNNNLGCDALKLPTKGYYVDTEGVVWYSDKNSDNSVGHVAPLPDSEKRTQLEWVVTNEEKRETVTCKKLQGSYQKFSTPVRRESPDGMRGGASQWGETPSPQAHFVADEYDVTVTYTATKAVNQFGEVVEGKPKFPPISTISYETGYGKITEYAVTELAVLDLPTEKVEKVYTDQREHFYSEGQKIVKEYLDNLSKPVEGLLKPGDVVAHPTHGQGTVKSVNGTSPEWSPVTVIFPDGEKIITAPVDSGLVKV